jgi:hypothetical protein
LLRLGTSRAPIRRGLRDGDLRLRRDGICLRNRLGLDDLDALDVGLMPFDHAIDIVVATLFVFTRSHALANDWRCVRRRRCLLQRDKLRVGPDLDGSGRQCRRRLSRSAAAPTDTELLMRDQSEGKACDPDTCDAEREDGHVDAIHAPASPAVGAHRKQRTRLRSVAICSVLIVSKLAYRREQRQRS